MKSYDVIVVGGGAAGFFAAINLATFNPKLNILLIEKGNQFLGKVKVSGGGRCNVTNACFDPKELVKFYPRGSKELLGPFHVFQPGDTFAWFQEHGVELKIEDDNRVFPNTDNSQTIIDCFLAASKSANIQLQLQTGVTAIEQQNGQWCLTTNRDEYSCDKLLIGSGSSPQMWQLCATLGLKLVNAVPSLFTFNCKHPVIDELQGVALPATVTVTPNKLEETGPLLITHWGLSGPAVLRLSAWGAEYLASKSYNFSIRLNFKPDFDVDEVLEMLKTLRINEARKKVGAHSQLTLPFKLWVNLVQFTKIENKVWADVTNVELQQLSTNICQLEIKVSGKSTFKDEFVTCGGIDLKQIDFKTMQAKTHPGLYFAGEVLNIDAITGGFNFQAAWTTGYIAAKAMAE